MNWTQILPTFRTMREVMNKKLGDYCPTPEAHGHPTPLPPEPDDGPLTERSPSVNPELHEIDVDISEYKDVLDALAPLDSAYVSLFLEPLTAGAIYLVKRPHVPGRVLEPMFLRVYQDDVIVFQDMVGERLTMGTNLARECIQKRYLTKDILEALAKTV